MAPRLTPLVVVALGCLALLPAPTLAQSVGVTAAVRQSAVGTPPAAKPRTMVLGDKVIHNERIDTNGEGLLQILLVDGTSFTVGPSSSLTIDSFVYDPGAGTAKVVATLGKGVFRFIGGKTSKAPEGAVLNTPVGTVGIRGGIGDFDFRRLSGIPIHIDMLFGDSITLLSQGTVLGRLFRNGYSLVVGPGGKVTVQKTPARWTETLQQAMAGQGATPRPNDNRRATRTALAKALGGALSGAAELPGDIATAPPGPGLAVAPPPPPLPPDLPDQFTGVSTWAEIDNSSLAGAGAVYTGDASARYNITPAEGGPLTADWNGRFLLGYSFAQRGGGGVFELRDTDGSDANVVIPVNPNRVNGPANFSGQLVEQNDGADGSRLTTVSGQFYDTRAGVAHGVGGSFDINGQNVVTQLPGGDSVRGNVTGTGAFGGTLQSTGQANP